MDLAVIKYNAGNIRSVLFALDRLGIKGRLTEDHNEIRQADKVIFPGVGEASSTMKYLKERGLDELIPMLRQPVLGVCLGLQLLCQHSEEGHTDCLGVFDHQVIKFKERSFKVPHMGWNKVNHDNSALFRGIEQGEHFYFVHSFYAEYDQQAMGKTEYGKTFSSALRRDNFYAVQFHPEKSAAAGHQLLKNFITL